MPRRMLTDELWSKLKGILRQHRIYDKPFLRDMVEGMLYRMRVGCPWRDLPKEFGCWNTIFQKFNRWSVKNKLKNLTPRGVIYTKKFAHNTWMPRTSRGT